MTCSRLPSPRLGRGSSSAAAQLRQAKQMLDEELISQEDYEALKAKILGL